MTPSFPLPRTYAEAVDRLIAELSPDNRDALRNLTEDDLPLQHWGLALYVRNNYGLNQDNDELLRSCTEEDGRLTGGQVVMFDADGASNLIARGAWEKLQEAPR